MTAIVLSLVFFAAAAGLLWVANRLATPTDTQTELPKNRKVAAGPVFFTAALVYWGLTALLARSFSVFGISLFLIVLLFAGNALKQKLLGEVLLFSDVFLAGHALRFPRLYFGYVPKWVWAVIAVLAIAIGTEIAKEPAYSNLRMLGLTLFVLSALAAVIVFRRLLARSDGFLQTNRPSFRAQVDAERFTPFGAALVHVVSHLTHAGDIRDRFDLNLHPRTDRNETQNTHTKTTGPLRHFVLIQAESYCPVSKLLNRPSTTPVIDSFLEKDPSGQLLLDWRGAYTMRTEFSVLTGIETTALDSYAFDPYQLARRIPMDSLARDFKAMGYDTIAWHPNDGRFFDRFAVMPHLGFSSLMDISAFADLPKAGHNVGDKALLEKAAAFLATCTRPTFLFIVTIEAHGPWSGNAQKQLAEYEAHLANLDQGVDILTRSLAKTNPGSTVALYGDHLPSLSAFKNAPPATAWFAHVNNDKNIDRQERQMNVHLRELRAVFLKIANKYNNC